MLTAEQILKVAQLTADYNGLDADEYTDAIVTTHEPIENFIAIADTVKRDADHGDGYVLAGVQRAKGESRTTIYAIDFGGTVGLYEV